jgi:two-component system, NtrC family, sensor histidine kinase KinB
MRSVRTMFGLRQKLLFGFGGLLAILLAVGALSIVVLQRYSNALQKFLSENYRSVEYGQVMKDELERLDDAAESAMVTGADVRAAATAANYARAEFVKNLQLESQNITLHPREDELVAQLLQWWEQYDAAVKTVLDPALPVGARRQALETTKRLSPQIREAAQEVISINLRNMVEQDGQVRQTARNAQKALLILIVAGGTLAIVFVFVLSARILRPLQTLTDSAREIERGNLDLVVRVRSRDEVGQLAEAFNSMAAKLREFRRSDRAKLVRTQRTTQLAVNSLPDAVAVVGPDGTVELANDAAQRLFGLRPEMPLSGSRISSLAELFDRAWREGRSAQSKGYESAVQVFDENGEKFFLPQAVPITEGTGADKQILGVTVVLADVTNLRRLDEMKSGMLSVVSHELKTPLTSIRMAVHLLLEERVGPLTPKQLELLVAARDDSDRLNQIIENLLDMGRMESGRVRMDLHRAAAEKLVRDSVEPAEAAYQDKGVELVADVAPDAPDVLADETRIDHVLANLLSNALRFTPPGGQVRVVAAPVSDQSVRFSVEDSGPGVPKQYQGRIFERFFRVPGQAGGSGAGLGLAIAKEIVEAHGGTIGVESEDGRGARFWFTLQRADRPPAHVRAGSGSATVMDDEEAEA